VRLAAVPFGRGRTRTLLDSVAGIFSDINDLLDVSNNEAGQLTLNHRAPTPSAT
jgi:hypothetical protein